MKRVWMGVSAGVGLALCVGLGGCKGNASDTPAPIIDANSGADPADANLAPADPNAAYPAAVAGSSITAARRQPGRVLGQRQASADQASVEQYPQEGTPNNGSTNSGQAYPQPEQGYQQAYQQGYDPAYDQYQSQANAGEQALYAEQPPPPLPVYQQPELTQENDQWTPGYWNFGSGGYYWVPGAWVAPPYTGALWTPGYWGSEGSRYRFHFGFWGRHIGFYGGIPYGFGYSGEGYRGGYWNGNRFFYNNAVNRVNVTVVHNVYVRNETFVNNSRVSYNGPGGWQVRPRPAELAVYREERTPPMQVQRERAQQAASNRQQFFNENHGRPPVVVSTQRYQADRSLPAPIRPMPAAGIAERGGFGRPQESVPYGNLRGQPAEQQQRQALQQQQATQRPQEPQRQGFQQQQAQQQQQQQAQQQRQAQQQQQAQQQRQQQELQQRQAVQQQEQQRQAVRQQQQAQPPQRTQGSPVEEQQRQRQAAEAMRQQQVTPQAHPQAGRQEPGAQPQSQQREQDQRMQPQRTQPPRVQPEQPPHPTQPQPQHEAQPQPTHAPQDFRQGGPPQGRVQPQPEVRPQPQQETRPQAIRPQVQSEPHAVPQRSAPGEVHPAEAPHPPR